MTLKASKKVLVTTGFPEDIHKKIEKYQGKLQYEEGRKITMKQSVIELVVKGLAAAGIKD